MLRIVAELDFVRAVEFTYLLVPVPVLAVL
jgi:hypothetical protein